MSSKYLNGVTLCIVATVAWGAMFPVMDSALKHIDPFTFTCMRYAIAGVVFLVLLLAREGIAAFRLQGERVWLAWFFGTAGFAGFQFLVFLGQQKLGAEGALIASIMMATMPMLGFLVNWVVRKAVPPVGAIVFIVISFVGVTLVITKGHYATLVRNPQDFGADGLIILGALCWVIYTIGASYFPHWSPVRYTTVTTWLGLPSACGITAVLLATGYTSMPSGHAVSTVLPELAYMSLVAAVVGVLAWNVGNKILTPLNGVLFMDVVPITTYMISAFTGDTPAAMQYLGAGISATALILNNVYLRHRMTGPSTPPPGPAEPQTERVTAVSRAASH
ncbi:DMT family transporter [Frankia sp. R82]|uniref:DMT family transporter n=1 Tax=Frankia sp. R82 TaxID=2950553 RepID=UPI002042C14F|nr:DMT family transporter [Frankia sp. R82]MCM3882292.1 DMT family transporter [Frankia sp. R82]